MERVLYNTVSFLLGSFIWILVVGSCNREGPCIRARTVSSQVVTDQCKTFDHSCCAVLLKFQLQFVNQACNIAGAFQSIRNHDQRQVQHWRHIYVNILSFFDDERHGNTSGRWRSNTIQAKFYYQNGNWFGKQTGNTYSNRRH